ncbi:glutathione-dependent formaldehyde-activating GFA [Spizellomyces punctatus DAOM BR117]|uniref:Glutathione-dependent formaldehyde-activating GFA n=1 Tax=Spizellomyces punctatus (strain DAOM BR117) TaxID=645134 RepID=A0A0L0HTH5_SPIPD|nr:glutathione-dependent formaldehyde-activating GFA [Spizellomyces punctatus DAOM BR117]KND04402.1 glutathione-dependent formaldehyde-activating GFA [Spizellomyces punctatus DAOM BR117]|eukprot:XP_016612441.1 glutathione-dependent formaldehyde-activating GFA [Spizellomyces punctatus DAOM BR117]
MTVCHCGSCRKAQGHSCVAVVVDATLFKWTHGQKCIREFESTIGKKRAFCERCGTPLYSRRDDLPTVLRLRMGTVDTPTDATPVAHIYATDVPAWAALDDDIPRYSELEPSRM